MHCQEEKRLEENSREEHETAEAGLGEGKGWLERSSIKVVIVCLGKRVLVGSHVPASMFPCGWTRGWKAAWGGKERMGKELSPDGQVTVRQVASSLISPWNRSPDSPGMVRVTGV